MAEQKSNILTIAQSCNYSLVVPRRIAVSARKGDGPPCIVGSPVESRWRQSAEEACSVAKVLTKTTDREILIRVDSGPVLTGRSAGLTVGLLALFSFLDTKCSVDFYATGAVDHNGYLYGGAGLIRKAEAVISWGQRDPQKNLILAPPVWPVPINKSIVTCTDLGSALFVVSPYAYSMIREEHQKRSQRILRRFLSGTNKPLLPESSKLLDTRPSDRVYLFTSQPIHGRNQRPVHVLFGDVLKYIWFTEIPNNTSNSDAFENIVSAIKASCHVGDISFDEKSKVL